MRIYDKVLRGPLGFGGIPLGCMFRDIPDDEAVSTVEAAWHHSTHLFDTAPFYDPGISLGTALAKYQESRLHRGLDR